MATGRTHGSAAPTVPPAWLAFLRTPGALEPGAVELVETHMSWVVLTAHRVWKLKKPVHLPYLDLRTLESRHRSCHEELRLGRRLATDVYLDILPITAGAEFAIGGDGEIVDWVLVMRRLPADRMLPELLARGAATVADADAVADVLSGFYQRAARAPWDGPGYRARLRATAVATAGELIERGAPGPGVGEILGAQLTGLDREAAVLDARVTAGRIVEAHGDLRPEHICLETPPRLIDPLEFSAELRMLDAVSELAFLALECDRLRAGWFGERVLARYGQRSGDPASRSLIDLYRRGHALVRALLALRHLVDAPAAQHPRWRARAADYLEQGRPPG